MKSFPRALLRSFSRFLDDSRKHDDQRVTLSGQRLKAIGEDERRSRDQPEPIMASCICAARSAGLVGILEAMSGVSFARS